MFLFKPKQKSDEVLPPPPPFSDAELEEELKEKPKFFDKILKPEEEMPENFPEQEEFSSLIGGLGNGAKPNKAISKIPKKILKKPNKAEAKPIKAKKAPQKKINTPKKAAKNEAIDSEEDFGIDNLDLGMPKKMGGDEFLGLPDTLEEFGMEGIETDSSNYGVEKDFVQGIKAKPSEIQEAEDEIKSAIEKIKKQEKPSFLSRLFAKKAKEEPEEAENSLMHPADADDMSAIQNKMKNAREALMRFDLEAAKMNYIEIMRLYNKISPDEKAEVYNDIKELYFERKSAEGLKA